MSLFYRNLYDLIFDSYPKDADEVCILAGYVGPEPIKDLNRLKLNANVVYGMALEQPRPILDNFLQKFDSKNEVVKIFYPQIICHSKIYIWLKENRAIKGLIGSANFSINALKNDYRETLFEVEKKELAILKGYYETILESSFRFKDKNVVEVVKKDKQEIQEITCHLELYTRDGNVGGSSGLNWGMNSGKNHTKLNDAYIAIRKNHIRNFPHLFSPKQMKVGELSRTSGKKTRQNEAVEIIWDDGEVMEALFEGSQDENGVKYPKQISSSPSKEILGKYLRNRLGVPFGKKIEMKHLVSYGRTSVSVNLISEGSYYFDFSV